MDLNNLLKVKEFSFDTNKILKKGTEDCHCHGVDNTGKDWSCKEKAYWRFDDGEFCDNCLPMEGRVLFLLNDWKKTDDKDLEYVSSDSDDEDDSYRDDEDDSDRDDEDDS